MIGIRLMVLLARSLGRTTGRLLLYGIAAWYVAFDAHARRASRTYLARIGHSTSLGEVFRHVLCFARVTFDRVFLATGDLAPFRLSTRGEEHLRALRDSGQGALLLLAHVGSFEALRALSQAQDLPVHMLGYFRNARMINEALRALNPGIDARLIEIRPSDPTFVFEVQRRIADGEIVATMADRIGLDGKFVQTSFLGHPVRLPPGPYLLAASLGCPVFLAYAIYSDPNNYEIHC